MVHAYMTCKYVFNINPGEVLWNTGDCGWATGHTCLCYGPQLNGATALIYEGIPSYPDHGRVWQVSFRYFKFTFHTCLVLELFLCNFSGVFCRGVIENTGNFSILMYF